jgi:Skp family chaperone for outer membrane proteins
MKQTAQKQWNTLAIVALLVVGSIAWQSQALRRVETAKPAVLVSVDFGRVFNSLEERSFEQEKAQALINRIDEDLLRRRKHIEDYEQELELYTAGSDKWEDLVKQQQLELIEYESIGEYRNLRAAREESKGLRSIYKNIRKACAELSKQNGWDYVFVNDLIAPMPEGDDVDMDSVISSRRMLYANQTMDVTDALIEHMNASFDEMAVR